MELGNDTDELFEMIKICVNYDLIGRGNFRVYENMSIKEQTQFTKQTKRLYDACILIPDQQNYIHERYDSIMKNKRKNIKL